MKYTPKHPSHWVKRRLASRLAYQPKRQNRGLEQTNHLSQKQAKELQVIAGTYTPDLHDPAAVEVLLVLLEVCHILQLSEYRLGKIFGSHLHALETWGDIVPPKRRPPQLQRAWVWVPNTYQPRLYPIGKDGTICIYPNEQDEHTNEEQG
ncbi:MAG: hypothetical protein U0X20_12210 [Caldilineaceae bacterium]